jgi:hypothetical protein
MKDEERNQKIKEVEAVLEQAQKDLKELRTPSIEPQRPRVALGESYEYVDDHGNVRLTKDQRTIVDAARHATGNYFLRETLVLDQRGSGSDAGNSTIYHAFNSEYEYWIPASHMPKPLKKPEGLEFYSRTDSKWLPSPTVDTSEWAHYTYRWPKTSYTGE